VWWEEVIRGREGGERVRNGCGVIGGENVARMGGEDGGERKRREERKRGGREERDGVVERRVRYKKALEGRKKDKGGKIL
jgi:hypothetical protein